MNKCLERVNDRHFWNPGVVSCAMIPWCRHNSRIFFFIVTSIVNGLDPDWGVMAAFLSHPVVPYCSWVILVKMKEKPPLSCWSFSIWRHDIERDPRWTNRNLFSFISRLQCSTSTLPVWKPTYCLQSTLHKSENFFSKISSPRKTFHYVMTSPRPRLVAPPGLCVLRARRPTKTSPLGMTGENDKKKGSMAKKHAQKQ